MVAANATNEELVHVDQRTRYGFKSVDVYYSLSPKSGLVPEDFEEGKEYCLQVWTNPSSGKKYVNKVLSGEQSIDTNRNTATVKKTVTPPTAIPAYQRTKAHEQEEKSNGVVGESPSMDRTLKPVISELEKQKNRRILFQGVLQAVIQRTVSNSITVDDWKKETKDITVDFVNFVENQL